ncbi:hypothetical protein LCGC14_2881660 [marine sediment metagenome]|uniref:DNA N-6-adenine-methyltransferase (Dam) n=1 Tax=marine sediment metagenome TaxID=412755 RepID=A0A0F9A7W4_9ZZZZ
MSHGKLTGTYYGKGAVKKTTTEWETPLEVFNKLNKEFRFTLDPCASKKNAKCKKYFTEKDDGLSKAWNGRVFMNPPYGPTLFDWIRKAASEVKKGNAEVVVCLVPVRTDNRWFGKFAKYAQIRFIRHRIHFGRNGVYTVGPFGSMLLIFRKDWKGHGRFYTNWDWREE